MTIATGQPLLASDINNLTFFPKGTILTFSTEAYNTTSVAFKNIWKICDGNYGTPNLVNKFLRGGSTSGAVGGADSQIVTAPAPLKKHSHTFTGTTATGYMPIGNANVMVSNGGMDGVFTSQAGYTWGLTEGSSGIGIKFSMTPTGNISETGSGEGDNINFNINTVPSYYTVIYIMKIS